MKKITGNEPVNSFVYTERVVFPHGSRISETVNKVSDGLTIRQYYAGLMMQALITDKPISAEPGFSYSTEIIRKLAVQYADDLIAELNKSESE